MFAAQMQRPPPTAIGNGRSGDFSGQLIAAQAIQVNWPAQEKSQEPLPCRHYPDARPGYLSRRDLLIRYGVSPRRFKAWTERRRDPFPAPVGVTPDGVLYWNVILLTPWERRHGG
jgi:hypothetical protein